MKNHIANIITGCRILGSVLLLFFPAFSVTFYILYLFCGITDMIDGTIARKTNSVSEFGENLDTVADIVFVAVCFIKILPLIHLPVWLIIWIAVIAIIKIGSIISGYVFKKQFISLHTVMNKITGFLLFLFPLTTAFIKPIYSSLAVCLIATFSAIREVVYIATDCENK